MIDKQKLMAVVSFSGSGTKRRLKSRRSPAEWCDWIGAARVSAFCLFLADVVPVIVLPKSTVHTTAHN